MTRGPNPRFPPLRGLLGMYSLAVMDQEGPVHGYRVADRVAGRTEGSWRPSPGALYPALQGLVERGLARSAVRGRRRIYAITPSGRRLLQGFRRHRRSEPGAGPDLGALWAEVLGVEDVGRFHYYRLRRVLTSIEAYFSRSPPDGAPASQLRRDVRAELERSVRRLGTAADRPGRERRAA